MNDFESKTEPKSVLIYDTDWKEGGSIRNCLEACGYIATAWNSVEEASKALAAHGWSLIVLSNEPGDEFYRVVNDIRSMKTHHEIILLTSDDECDPLARGLPESTAVLTRPFRLNDLADLAEHLLGED